MSEGVLYVEILPSTKGIGKAVEKDAEAAFKGAEKTGTSFFSKVGTWAKRGAVAIGGMVAGVAALAVGGGISRALNIEDAQAKLRGLGHDTQSVEAIMNDALASVKGTAFGLDAAATTAAAAVASGIKPGQELERYLRLTADAATIAGVSMEEMGSIINKVQAKGKAQMEDLNRLTERGIPIMQMLADEYGVTAEEMSDMVSRGEVDAARFRKALEDNVGGAALESGNTTRGAFANMRAAMSRWGLALIGDGLGAAKTFFNEVTVIFDGLTERMTPWVEAVQAKLGEMFQLEGMGDRFLEWFDRTAVAIANGPIPQIINALAPIIPVIADVAEMIGSALGDALKELGSALAPVLPEVAQALADAVVELAPSLTDLLVALVPLIPPLVELLAALIPIAVEILEQLIPAIEWLVEALTPGIDALSMTLDYLNGDIDGEGFLRQALELGGQWGQMVENVLIWTETVHSAISNIQAFIAGTLGTIVGYFTFTWNTIGLVVGGALKVISGLVTGNMALVRDGINQALTAIRNWWNTTWSGIASSLSGVWSSIVSAVANGVNNVVAFVASLPGRIAVAVSALPGLLVGVGQQMIQGLINGVSSMIQRAVGAVMEVGGAMLSSVKSFLGIKSPSRVFRDEVGKMVGLGLLAGIEDSAIRGRIDTAVSHLVAVPDQFGTAAGATYEQNNTINMYERDPRLLMRQLGREFAGAVI